MADPFVFPGVCRFAVHGTFAGRPIVNVLDMHIDSVLGSGRSANILDQAKVIVANWSEHMTQLSSGTVAYQSVSWVDMTSVDGEIGSTTASTNTHVFPMTGGYANAAMPGNVAIVLKKATSAARGSRQGRMFIVGLPESYTDSATPNTITAEFITNSQPHVTSFLNGINQDAGIGGGEYNSKLVVCHTKDTAVRPNPPVIVANGYSNVTALTIDSKIHSQRRRLG